MQRLQEVRAFISEDEYERRKAEILDRAGNDFESKITLKLFIRPICFSYHNWTRKPQRLYG